MKILRDVKLVSIPFKNWFPYLLLQKELQETLRHIVGTGLHAVVDCMYSVQVKLLYSVLICRITVTYWCIVIIVTLTSDLVITLQTKPKSFFFAWMNMVCWVLMQLKCLCVCIYMCSCLLWLCWIGIEQKLHFTYCKCEPLAVTMTRAHAVMTSYTQHSWVRFYIFPPWLGWSSYVGVSGHT